MPEDQVDIVMRERLAPILRASLGEPNVLKSLMISCYLQGAVDAMNPAVRKALRQASSEAP